ncbi:hypothetical protein IE81DRAFT_79221 [Ceraceosorus guamensis]|uniref:Enoyl reductase (ER) domain-containing protein n=1 Tax=Ceraceosorus guamensis TaxID=1522189 RepID=A0A316VM74_9BASI|nr:hypothetical protein IE81DRAFT_79221 [Ceraceosorus guamensis]PWN38729.1 hypothetical protein IE81DRAFT_79221 [Ceraceosorus guamensis]
MAAAAVASHASSSSSPLPEIGGLVLDDAASKPAPAPAAAASPPWLVDSPHWLVASQQEVHLGGGWDEEPMAGPATPPSFSPQLGTSKTLESSSASLSGSSEESGRSTPSDREHAATSAAAAAAAAKRSKQALDSGLLVRSTRQGWERSFDLNQGWPTPKLDAEDEVLVKNLVAGLNPVDFKSVLYNFGIPDTPWVLGRDVAGVVETVGSRVTDLKPGQRVWTCADSRDVRAGAYQTRSVCKRDLLCSVPDNVSDEQAATLGTGLITAAVCVYWFLRLPRALSLGDGKRMARNDAGDLEREEKGRKELATAEKPWILIYGGSAITGQYIAQLSRLAGVRVLVIAAPSNFQHLRSSHVGVEAVIDRHLSSDAILDQIQEITKGSLEYAIDCVGSKTAAVCEAALRRANSRDGRAGQLICLAGNPKAPTTSGGGEVQGAKEGFLQQPVLHKLSFSTTIYGDSTFARALNEDLQALLASGELQAVRYELVPDGLAGVRRGLEALRDGTAPSGHKLIVRITDTPHADSVHLGVKNELCWNGIA